ncbi:hypothetical protein K440DRAFT_625630 [Wilcoxina mikolae CBS 423.85]|nr:hypothetical protein K440DRAFT_625630 [Wilcoxina mikolae CBS 423.85]
MGDSISIISKLCDISEFRMTPTVRKHHRPPSSCHTAEHSHVLEATVHFLFLPGSFSTPSLDFTIIDTPTSPPIAKTSRRSAHREHLQRIMRLSLISATLCGLSCVALAQQQPAENQNPNTAASPTTAICSRQNECPSTTSVNAAETTSNGSMQVNGNPTSESTPTSLSSSKNPGPKSGAIIGGVVAGVVVLALFAILFFFFLRRRKRRGDPKSHHEAIGVLDKSRASSPASHASPVYGGAHPPIDGSAPPPPPPPIATYHDRQTTYDEPHQQPQQQLPPPHPVIAPAELQSREVDEDGVSVSSFDMQRPQASSVPRLPVYQRATPPGSSTTGL